MKEFVKVLVAILALVALSIAASSCGGSRHSSALTGSQLGSLSLVNNAGGQHEITLDSALAELDALPTPDGVDATTFEQLKSSLADALRSTGAVKFTSTPPTGTVNRIADFTLLDGSGGDFDLAWHYRNIGDYNQDGTVGVADITPLAIYFGQQVNDPNSLQGVADGDGDGIIGVTDITPIAMNFANTVASYEIQNAPATSGPWDQMGSLVPFSAGVGPERLLFEVTIPETVDGYGRVEPLDAESVAGDPSNNVQFTELSEIPEIISVSPEEGITGHNVQFSANVDGTRPLTYSWDFGGGATPNISSEATPTVILGAVGQHFATLTVDNANGTSVFNFILTVTGTGVAPEVISVSPNGGFSGQIIQLNPFISGSQPFTYLWDFGGGAMPNMSISATPVITLRTAGEYACSLTVNNAFGSDTFNFVLHVSQLEVAPTIRSVFHTAGITGSLLTPGADVTGTSPLAYSWDFNGGATPNTSNAASPGIMLGPVGSYFCTLTVTNHAGSDTFIFVLNVTAAGVAPTINFVLPAEGITGTPLSFGADVSGSEPLTYAWNFGGAGTPNTSHDHFPVIVLGAPGTYLGSLTVTNATGTDTDSFIITVVAAGEAPVIQNITPTGGIESSIVQFSTTLTGTAPFDFSWDFGGGATPNTSSNPSPTVMLGAAGVYPASLTVTNAFGSDTLNFDLSVTTIGNTPVILSVIPQEGVAGSFVNFFPSVTGTQPYTFAWDFGGGATPNTTDFPSPSVTLGAVGTYSASLTVTNAYGSDTYLFTLTVTTAPNAPSITAVQPLSGNADDHRDFYATVTGTPPLSYDWNFGGAAVPNTSKKAEPWENLTTPGTYNCSLTVTNAYGSDTFNFVFTVNAI
jgi:PKD repeat protein